MFLNGILIGSPRFHLVYSFDCLLTRIFLFIPAAIIATIVLVFTYAYATETRFIRMKLTTMTRTCLVSFLTVFSSYSWTKVVVDILLVLLHTLWRLRRKHHHGHLVLVQSSEKLQVQIINSKASKPANLKLSSTQLNSISFSNHSTSLSLSLSLCSLDQIAFVAFIAP